MDIITAKHLNYAYGSDAIISDLTFTLKKGDYVGIIGQNGSGKSTLLKLLLGLIKPQSGKIYLFEKPLREFREWHRIGYVPQRSGIFDKTFPATVEEIVEMGIISRKKIFHRLDVEDHRRMKSALEVVDLLHMKNKLIHELSGGQQQRVLIARALAGKPDILILDEPVVGIDMIVQKKFYDLLKRLNKELDITLILISHDLDTVAHEADYLMLMNKGELCACTKDMIEKDKKHYVTL